MTPRPSSRRARLSLDVPQSFKDELLSHGREIGVTSITPLVRELLVRSMRLRELERRGASLPASFGEDLGDLIERHRETGLTSRRTVIADLEEAKTRVVMEGLAGENFGNA